MTTTINDAAGEFTAPGEIVFIRRLPGPIERVWTYLTEPEKRRRWLADGPMELRVGGRVELQFHHHELAEADDAPPPKYESMACSQPTLVGRVLRCEPPHALSYTWEDGDKGGSEVTFELSPVGDDVQLLLRHRRLGEDPAVLASVGAGWHAHVAILISRLEDESAPSFWSLHTSLEADYARRLATATAR